MQFVNATRRTRIGSRPASHIGFDGISDISRPNLRRSVADLTESKDREYGLVGFARRVVHPEPERYLNSNAPADSFNIIGYPRFNAKAWHASADKRHA